MFTLTLHFSKNAHMKLCSYSRLKINTNQFRCHDSATSYLRDGVALLHLSGVSNDPVDVSAHARYR